MKSKLLNSSNIFYDVSKESFSHFKEEGFCHYRFKNLDYLEVIQNCFKYASTFCVCLSFSLDVFCSSVKRIQK